MRSLASRRPAGPALLSRDVGVRRTNGFGPTIGVVAFARPRVIAWRGKGHPCGPRIAKAGAPLRSQRRAHGRRFGVAEVGLAAALAPVLHKAELLGERHEPRVAPHGGGLGL